MVGAVVSVVRSGEDVAVAEVDVVEDSAEDGETQISGELVGAVVSGAPTLKRLQLSQPRTPTIASTATTPTASTAMTPAPGPPGCPSVAGPRRRVRGIRSRPTWSRRPLAVVSDAGG